MVDFIPVVVNTLKTILPTYHELTLTSGIRTPCISYSQRNDYAVATGDTLGYSRLQFQIKVWSDKVSELMTYSLQIDEKMRLLGFNRISAGELWDRNSAMKQKILVYEALANEQFESEVKNNGNNQ